MAPFLPSLLLPVLSLIAASTPNNKNKNIKGLQESLSDISAAVVSCVDDPDIVPELSFSQWCIEQGIESRAAIQDSACAIVGGGGGCRGLIAKERIEAGEIVVKVPLSATILQLITTTETTATDSWDDIDDDWAGLLAAKLLKEQKLGLASKYAPYLKEGLPNVAPFTPCRWSEDELTQLQNNTFISEVERNNCWRQEQCRRHCLEKESTDTFFTMLDLVCSRTLVRGRNQPSSCQRMLVPLIDIANHVPLEAGGGEFKVDHEAVYLFAGIGGIDAGQPVTLDYGPRTVEDFLLHYGFVPDRCWSDSVNVDVDVDQHQHQCNTTGSSSTRSSSSSSRTLRWMDCSYHGHADQGMKDTCAGLLLHGYPTSMSEDLDLLLHDSKKDVTGAFSLALKYRFAKKSLLAAGAGISAFRQ